MKYAFHTGKQTLPKIPTQEQHTANLSLIVLHGPSAVGSQITSQHVH